MTRLTFNAALVERSGVATTLIEVCSMSIIHTRKSPWINYHSLVDCLIHSLGTSAVQ